MLRYALIGKRLGTNVRGQDGFYLTFKASRSDGTGTDGNAEARTLPPPATEWHEWVTPEEADRHELGDEFALERR